MLLTRVGTPPLIAIPAHKWQTLITILMQVQNIKMTVVRQNRRTVMSLDMGLHQPAKKLQMSRQDLGHIILRPGYISWWPNFAQSVHSLRIAVWTCAWSSRISMGLHCEANSRWEPREEKRSGAHGYITSSIRPLPGSLLCETPSCVHDYQEVG